MNDVLSLPQDESFFAGLYQHQAATLRHLLLNGVTHYTLFWEMGCGRTPVAARLDWEHCSPARLAHCFIYARRFAPLHGYWNVMRCGGARFCRQCR